MTRFRIGLLILALLLAAGIWGQCSTAAIHQPIARAMEEAAALALSGDWNAAARKTAEAQEAWQRSRTFTAAITDHSPMEEIECLLSQLPSLSAAHNRSAYAAACHTLSCRLQSLAESQQLSWGSLF